MSNENTAVPTFKVGDKIVFSYLQEMEPGVIRKIQGSQAFVDVGNDKLYEEDVKHLIKVESEASLDFSQASPTDNTQEVFKAVSDAIDYDAKIEDANHKLIAAIKFENEYKDGLNNIGEKYDQLSFDEVAVGEKVRRVGTKRIGTIVSIDNSANNYRVRWDDTASITTNWKQELTIARQ